MYPHEFRPSTTGTVFDGLGHNTPFCELQLFKPLLGFVSNGPQVLIRSARVPNMAGAILRGLVHIPAGSPLALHPGPQYWLNSQVPYIVLIEDPNAEHWNWLDAIPWTLLSGDQLWSFFAAKNTIPPQDGPVIPTVGGPSSTPVVIDMNTVYSVTIPPFGNMWWYAPMTFGCGGTFSLLQGTDPTAITQLYQGNAQGVSATIGPLTFGPSNIAIDPAPYKGPHVIHNVVNPGGAPINVIMQMTSSCCPKTC
jgi:hypothetical protein